jgi:hypothetical protein
MNRLILLCALAAAVAACGDPELAYTDPTGGALRLIKNPMSNAKAVVLEFVVGDAALTGYSTGFDLPLDTSKVKLAASMPGTVLSPGSAPVAASAAMPSDGPLRGTLVVGLSQKATGTGAVATDTVLPPGTVLYTVELDAVAHPDGGVVFDGTANNFVLPSGGLRNRAGVVVVDASHVKIGKLELR